METFTKTLVILLFAGGGIIAVVSGHTWTAVVGFVAATLVYKFVPATD